MLDSLNVENIVLPAAEEAESIWTNKFGFTKMSEERVSVLSISMMLCWKTLNIFAVDECGIKIAMLSVNKFGGFFSFVFVVSKNEMLTACEWINVR